MGSPYKSMQVDFYQRVIEANKHPQLAVFVSQ